MAIDSTQLYEEVRNITEKGQGLAHYQLEARVLIDRTWFDLSRLLSLSIERDYEDSYGDVVVLTCDMGLGDYAYRIYPNRDGLRVELTVTPLYENTAIQRSDASRRARRYRAILMNQENPGVESTSPQVGAIEDLNRTRLQTVDFQLVDDVLHQVRMMTVGDLYRRMTPMAVLQTVLSDTTTLLDRNNRQVISGVTVQDGYNKTVREHIPLDHGMALKEVPSFLQNEAGGVYATGLGCYLQDGQWQVFPLYDTQRFDRTDKTLTIISVPPNRYYGGERTYRRTRDGVVIVTAGGNKVNDPGLAEQLNKGNAVRFMDSRRLLDDTTQPDGNKARMPRQENLFEFQGPALEGGYTNAQWAEGRSGSSPFQHYTEMARRNGRYVMLEWQHGDAALLYPGMPVKMYVPEGEQVVTRYGILLGLHEVRAPQEAGPIARRFPAIIRLKVFLERPQGL